MKLGCATLLSSLCSAAKRVPSVSQKWIQVPLLLCARHRDGGHDEGLLALGQREGHSAAPGAPTAEPQQPLLCLAQVGPHLPMPTLPQVCPGRPPPFLDGLREQPLNGFTPS